MLLYDVLLFICLLHHTAWNLHPSIDLKSQIEILGGSCCLPVNINFIRWKLLVNYSVT